MIRTLAFAALLACSTALAYESVLSHGALCDGATDDTAAFQATVDALPANGGAVYVPTGDCKVVNPVFVTHSHVRIFGDGEGSRVDGSGNNRPVFIFYPPGWADIPTQAAIVGTVLPFDFPDNQTFLNLSEVPPADMPIDGQPTFGIAAWWYPYSAGRGGPNYLISSFGKSTSGGTQKNAFYINDNGGGTVQCGITTANGTFTANAGGTFTLDAANHVELSYDGSNLRCFVNGTKGADTPATGAMKQEVYEQVIIGGQYAQWGPLQAVGNGPRGRVGNLILYLAPLHTANFTSTAYQNPLSGQIAAPRSDAITHITTNMTNTGGGADRITFTRLNINDTLTGDEVDHLNFVSTGRPIQMFSVINANVHDLLFDQVSEDAISLNVLSYGSSIRTIRGIGSPRTFINVQNSGVTFVRDFYLVGAKIAGVVSVGAGIPSLSDGYVVTSGTGLYDVWINGYGGSQNLFHAHSLALSTESGSIVANMCLESLVAAFIDSTNFESSQLGATALLRLDNSGGNFANGFPVKITGSILTSNGPTYTADVFDFVGTWNRRTVTIHQSISNLAGVPYATAAQLGNLVVFPLGQ